MMIAANDVGYIPKMIKMANELGLSEEEKAKIIEQIDKLESMAKVPMQVGQPRNLLMKFLILSKLLKKKSKIV